MNPHLESQELDLRELMDTDITTIKLLKGSSKLDSLDITKAPLRSLIWTKEITTLRNQLKDTTLRNLTQENPPLQESFRSNFSLKFIKLCLQNEALRPFKNVHKAA